MSEVSSKLVEHLGGCHCGRVKFSVQAPSKNLLVIDCNCSICNKKQNKHFIVPKSSFKLLSGENYLTTYEFNTMQAKHMFCRVCGVQSFYQPRSNSDGWGVMPHCIDSMTIESTVETTFNGQSWESSFEDDKIIRNLSK